MLHIPALWYFGTSVTYPPRFHRVKLVVIPPRFIWQQYLWNIAIQLAVGCYNSWANLRCSGCYPLGEKLLWNRSIEHCFDIVWGNFFQTFWCHLAHFNIWSVVIMCLMGVKMFKKCCKMCWRKCWFGVFVLSLYLLKFIYIIISILTDWNVSLLHLISWYQRLFSLWCQHTIRIWCLHLRCLFKYKIERTDLLFLILTQFHHDSCYVLRL